MMPLLSLVGPSRSPKRRPLDSPSSSRSARRKSHLLVLICWITLVFSFRNLLYSVNTTSSTAGTSATAPPSSSKIVLAVLNGGQREEDYFSPLYESLKQLQRKHGYDILVLSDQHNSRERESEIVKPNFPDNLIFQRFLQGKKRAPPLHAWKISIMWFSLVPLLLDKFPNAEAFWISENDAHFCNATRLVDSFHWFLHNSTNAKSLSYWSSCGYKASMSNALSGELGSLRLYKRKACGMVSTLFTRTSLQRMHSVLESEAIFETTIEGLFLKSGVSDASIENGQVLVHGGYKSNNGGEWGNYTCQDPQGVLFKHWEKEQAALAIASGKKPREYIG